MKISEILKQYVIKKNQNMESDNNVNNAVKSYIDNEKLDDPDKGKNFDRYC